MTTIAEAMAILRKAQETNPEAVLRAEMLEVVKDTPLCDQRATPAPSFAGQSPLNAGAVAARQRYHNEAQRASQALQERSAAQINADLEHMASGQAPSNTAAILRQRQ